MIVLALVALLVAAAAVVFMIVRGIYQDVSFSFFAGDFTTNPLTIFIAGAVAMLLVLFALSLFRRGTRRKVAQRREIKRLRKVEETSVPAEDVRASASARHDRDHDDINRGDTNRSDTNRSDTNRSDTTLDDQERLVREPRRGDEGRNV